MGAVEHEQVGRQARTIDWGAAEVEGAILTAPLLGDCPRGWVKRGKHVLRMLDHSSSRWGEIELSRKSVRVADVEEGAEQELAHLLESAVMQANADVFDEEEADAALQPSGEEDEAEAVRDRRMTASFRELAAG